MCWGCLLGVGGVSIVISKTFGIMDEARQTSWTALQLRLKRTSSPPRARFVGRPCGVGGRRGAWDVRGFQWTTGPGVRTGTQSGEWGEW